MFVWSFYVYTGKCLEEINQMSTIAISDTEIMADFYKNLFSFSV